jgi:hypothetical protein
MPLDILTGELTPEPYVIPEEEVDMQYRYVCDLAPGENSYLDLHALWADPHTGELHIDGTYPVVSEDEVTQAGYNLAELARVVAIYKDDDYHYVVDIAHVQEAARASGEPRYRIRDVSAAALPEQLERSEPASALIQDSLSLELFCGLLQDLHGPDAVLSDIQL